MYVQKGRITNRGGYNYIVPDYWQKYASIDVFETEIELYKTAYNISEGKNNSALDKYQVELTLQFMASLMAKKFQNIRPFFRTLGFRVLRPLSFKAIFNKSLNFISKRV